MDSDSEESRTKSDFSNISIGNVSSNNGSPRNQSQQSDQISLLATDIDESLIITRPNKKRQPIWDSDSESDADADTKSKSNTKHDESDLRSESESDARNSESDSESDERENSDEEEDEVDKSKNKSQTKNKRLDSVDDNDSSQISMQNQSGQSDGSNQKSLSNNDSFQLASISKRSSSTYESDASVSSLLNTTDSPSVIIPETDDEEADEDVRERSEIHVYSPRTRRSITGRRSIKPMTIDTDTDDDEIFSNGNDRTHADKYRTALEIDTSNEMENERSNRVKRNRSIVANDSISLIKAPDAKRHSLANKSTSLRTSTPSRSTPDIEFSEKSDDQSSSIDIQSSHSEEEMKSLRQNDSSVVILNSSDEENHQPFANSTRIDFNGVNQSTPGTSKGKLIQPKLSFARTPLKLERVFVSRDHYNKKKDEVIKAKQELESVEELLMRLGQTLPDKGNNLKRRIKELTNDVTKLETEMQKYAIEEDHLDEVIMISTTNNNQPKTIGKDWRSDLEAIQPRWTGQQGLSTFNTQKTLTLNRIEKLHKAMDKCPTADDLAQQPDNLNVQLMPHQLHAIKWMRWREIQKPKGGILADDMGLGKTLTVIGLVLDVRYRKEISMVHEDDEEENTDDEDGSDDEAERGYNKSYANQGGTLIVCPASLINQWEKEVLDRVKRRKLTILMHHGNKREESVHRICKYDLVITSYGIIRSEHKTNSALFRIRWNRIVLDEAHMIRGHATAVAKGCCDLRSNIRWGLTGTPIQNKHMDVYAMLKFLRVTPFDDLATYKKWIDPKTEGGLSRLHNILKPLLLRRTKAELQIKGELQALPEKHIEIIDIELSTDEANVYTKILAYSQTLFAQYMLQHQDRTDGSRVQLGPDVQKRLEQVRRFGRGQEVKSSQILVLLLRLRQICDHPGLINQMLQDECDLQDGDEEQYDTIDMNIVKQMIGLKINDETNHRNDDKSKEDTKPDNVLLNTNKVYDFNEPSSKCNQTIEIVMRILRESNDKVVVVSQWTSFLSIVAEFLHRKRVHYVELTGKTPIKDRNNIVVSFNNPDSPERVMMLSLVAGGVGLNLTGANHLILLDPHWNPQLESQAFDRIYRVGQTKNVNIYKLLCANTVEKRIQSIQDSKLALSNDILTGSKQTSGSKLSIQDMRQLFDM